MYGFCCDHPGRRFVLPVGPKYGRPASSKVLTGMQIIATISGEIRSLIESRPLRFSIRILEPLVISMFVGATLRGAFGATFKRMRCILPRQRVCHECPLRSGCVYFYVFETEVPSGSPVLRSLQEIPRPFVVEPLTNGRHKYDVEDDLVFDMILIGKAIEYLQFFILAIEEMGRRGIGGQRRTGVLRSVTCPWSGRVIYRAETRRPELSPEDGRAPETSLADIQSLTVACFSPFSKPARWFMSARLPPSGSAGAAG